MWGKGSKLEIHLQPLKHTMLVRVPNDFTAATILATKLAEGYHKLTGPPRITLKVDIAKAFDTLNWDFLFICLSTL